MDSAITCGRLYPAYTTAELRGKLRWFASEPAKYDKILLALRQRDKSDAAYIPTISERLRAARA